MSFVNSLSKILNVAVSKQESTYLQKSRQFSTPKHVFQSHKLLNRNQRYGLFDGKHSTILFSKQDNFMGIHQRFCSNSSDHSLPEELRGITIHD